MVGDFWGPQKCREDTTPRGLRFFSLLFLLAFPQFHLYFFLNLGDDNTIPFDRVSFLLPHGNPGHVVEQTSATPCMT